MEKIVGIDAIKTNEDIVLTFTTKNEKIDFLKFSISKKELEYVNLVNIPKDYLMRMRMLIDDIFEREIKVQEILEKEFKNDD